MKFCNIFYETPLSKAIEKGNLEIVQLLLARKDINVNLKLIFIQYII